MLPAKNQSKPKHLAGKIKRLQKLDTFGRTQTQWQQQEMHAFWKESEVSGSAANLKSLRRQFQIFRKQIQFLKANNCGLGS